MQMDNFQENDDMKEKIRNLIKQLPEDYKIIEDQVDINLQMAYFELSGKVKTNIDEESVLKARENLFIEAVTAEDKKTLLVKLASIDSIDAYRTIERFSKVAEGDLKSWGQMALLESRMLIESSFLDESQVLISSGLGGRDKKMRYFSALMTNSGKPFDELQMKIIKNEFSYFLKQYNGDSEVIEFDGSFFTIIFLMPLEADLPGFIEKVLSECNVYGNFLNDKCLLTNVKKFNKSEIIDFFNGDTEKFELNNQY
jgi:hypothetical protein